jgi:hypothetical protein
MISEKSCQISLNETGTCIHPKQCPSILEQSQKTLVINDKKGQFLKNRQCGDKVKEIVCCPNTTMKSFAREQALKWLPSIGKCGVARNDHIIDAERTQIDEFPWLALIQYSDGR